MESLFVRKLALSLPKAKETAKNKLLAATLCDTLAAVGFDRDDDNCPDKQVATLLYSLGSTIKSDKLHLPYIARKIVSRHLDSQDKVAAAVKFVAGKSEFSDSDFDVACGVGVEISPDQISQSVADLLVKYDADLSVKRYTMVPALLSELRTSLRWANQRLVKENLDAAVLAKLGPKDERDDPKAKKKKEKEAAAAAAPASTEKTPAPPPTSIKVAEASTSVRFVFEGDLAKLHKPGGNPQLSDEIMAAHLARTGGKVVTRFPPEPNGYLHLGHCKAINVNFGYAQAHNGICYLRYDDTNPEAEKQEYFDAILEMLRWLGFEPYQITYSSDHFQRLFDLAVDLIKRGKAYVCHCTGEQMSEMRGGKDNKGPRVECIHRNRPIQESLTEFYKMKEGRYAEGEATLRMKMNMQDGNPQFWDLVAYRVMYTTHVRTGDDWCIYPTYDYTHCLCDSFEDITHSLCTTEFQQSRPSYYWLVDALEIYKPVQWEYGRLNVTHSIMSKRKLKKLVDEGYVHGWDDPRMFTLAAMRRRGFTPQALNAFVRDLGVSKNDAVIPVERLENYVRDHLNDIAPRLMVVFDPVKVVIENYEGDEETMITVANKPRDEKMGTHQVPFTGVVYIDSSDFRETADANYYRLSIGKTVGLLNVPWPITATGLVKNEKGDVVEIKARYEVGIEKKPKTYIQWVAESAKHSSPVPITVNMYDRLFQHVDPEDEKQVPKGWLSDVNPESLKTVQAYAEVGIRGAKAEDKFQFVRVGYFCVDKESRDDRIVINSTVSLKEDSGKKEVDKK